MPRYHQPSQLVRLRRIGAPSPPVRSGFRCTTSSAATAASTTTNRDASTMAASRVQERVAAASAGTAGGQEDRETPGGVWGRSTCRKGRPPVRAVVPSYPLGDPPP